MPLKLHPECRKRLVEAIEQRLSGLKVDSGVFLHESALESLYGLDAILPANREQIGLVGEFGDQPVMNFVFETISGDLRADDRYEPGSKPLTQLPAYAEPAAAAERIVAAFETLPWRYSLYLRSGIPSAYSEAFRGIRLDLGATLRLVIPTEENVPHLDVKTLAEAGDKMVAIMQRREVPDAWDLTSFYFAAEVSGYIGRYTSQRAITRFAARVKAFYGMLLIFGIASHQQGLDVLPTRNAILRFGCPDGAGLNWLVTEDAAHFSSIRVKELTDLTTTHHAVLRALIPMAFQPQHDRIRTAIRWLFDSFVGGSELLSFVQATVALQILFGDKAISDIVGIGRLIANRCAYLIGDTFAERQQIISDIQQIYDTRSAIVHRGKEELTQTETSQLTRLRVLCARSVGQELWMAHKGSAEGGA